QLRGAWRCQALAWPIRHPPAILRPLESQLITTSLPAPQSFVCVCVCVVVCVSVRERLERSRCVWTKSSPLIREEPHQHLDHTPAATAMALSSRHTHTHSHIRTHMHTHTHTHTHTQRHLKYLV